MHGPDASPIPMKHEQVVPPQKTPAPNLGEVGRSFCLFGVRKPWDDVHNTGSGGRQAAEDHSPTVTELALNQGKVPETKPKVDRAKVIWGGVVNRLRKGVGATSSRCEICFG